MTSRPSLSIPAVALLALAAACTKGDDKNAFAPPPPPEVVVASPVQREVIKYLAYTGVLEASSTVELRARVQGFLESVNFKIGQAVKKGDLLFVIDKREYQVALDRAEAAVRAQEANLLGATNDAKLARDLADQKAGPEIDAIIKAARKAAIDGDLAVSKAQRDQAKLDLGFCEIHAPLDGRITKNFVDPGNLVGRNEPTLLATMVCTAPVQVSVDVSETDVLAIQRKFAADGKIEGRERGQSAPGQWIPVELALRDETEFKTLGRVDYVAPDLDLSTGTLEVRSRFENENDFLSPGLFARLRFPMEKALGLLVPEAALLSDMQGRYALVVNRENVVEQRRVVIGVLEGDMRVVTEGLAPGDRVIVVGVLKARPGAKVTPVEKDAAAAKKETATPPPAEAPAKKPAEPPAKKPDEKAPAEKKPDDKTPADPKKPDPAAGGN